MPPTSLLRALQQDLTGREIILDCVVRNAATFVTTLQYAADRMDEATFDYILKLKGNKRFLDYAMLHRMRADKRNVIFAAKLGDAIKLFCY